MSLSLQWLHFHSHKWGWLPFEQGCCGQSLNEPQGPQTPGTGESNYGRAGKNGDKYSTPAVVCAFSAPRKIRINKTAEDWHIQVLVCLSLKYLSGSVTASESSNITWTISAQREELYVSSSVKGQELPAQLVNVINCHLSVVEELWSAGFSYWLVCLASPTRV